MKKYKIAVAGTGYVGLSIATLLSQHHHVTAVDILPEKVALINARKSPIRDDYIEKYLAEKELDLTATLDAKAAYAEGFRGWAAQCHGWCEGRGTAGHDGEHRSDPRRTGDCCD